MSYMREDKQEIMNLLLKTLQATREYSDLVSLEYTKSKGLELVVAEFDGGYRKPINVALDSGSAMIRDVLKALR